MFKPTVSDDALGSTGKVAFRAPLAELVCGGCAGGLCCWQRHLSVQQGDVLSLFSVAAGRRHLVAQLGWPMWEQSAPRATQEALTW